ncbi:MAG: hypothetical protein U9R14_00255 [Patescibacteria group bacterium]|nr:hypothetical protein [Patescibacteria group bacterium]
MKKFDLKAEKELLELIEKINKTYKKKISWLKHLLKKNNFQSREAVRELVRFAEDRNDDLFKECHSLYRFLNKLESEITKHL